MAPTRFPRHLKPIEPQGQLLLQQERSNATFDIKHLTEKIYGRQYLETKDRILSILVNDPVLNDKSHRYYTGRNIRFKKAMQAAKRMAELIKKHQWTPEEINTADMLFDEAGPFRLHRSMFIPTIEGQGTEEQKKLFLEPAQRYEIIGCYAQTELGHGSNVRGLETTATYDPATQSFIFQSPTLTSSKWWIGGLGKTATHAVVMARLFTNGKDHGPHPFIVQLRDLVSHEPLPGITVGDIGPKFGFGTVDNGFLMFDNYRVPHVSLLARFSQVDKITGDYIKPPNDKLSYGTMVFVRANIVMESRYVLARAATVAIRYSAIRAQGSDAANPKKIANKVVETPVLDYMMQQYRLLPILAQSYACHFTGEAMHRMYYENQERMAHGDFSYLADLHASSSGLKSLTTTMAVAAIEECRRACGGHGYLLSSGLGQFYQDYLPKATWEGDNYLLTQQTTRYLLKTFRSVRAGKSNDKNFSAQYMTEYLTQPKAQCPVTEANDFSNPETILTIFKYRVAFMVEQAVHGLDIEKRTWNDMLVEIYRISRAHCQLIMVSNFFQGVFGEKTAAADAGQNNVAATALGDVSVLYALSTLEQEVADVLTSGYVTPVQSLLLKHQVITTLKKVRPNAVALVDAFDFSDYLLNSALGESQGKVYERLTEMAGMEPLNHTSVVDGYDDHYRPLIHAGKANWELDDNGVAHLRGYLDDGRRPAKL